MTVEEYIATFVELLKNHVREKNAETKSKLDLQMASAKSELLMAHCEVLAALEPHHKPSDASMVDAAVNNTTDKENPANATITKSATTAVADDKPVQLRGIKVDVLSGSLHGSTFQLEPRPRAPCFIGRSTGKKFTERGISLSSDLEVSTTHGKFEIKKGSYFYIDQGSTNGSYIGDDLLEPHEPLELVDGLVITVGTSDLKITLLTA